MELRNLELFLHLADSLHFARTADAMAVSPSTLSRAIQRLEQEVGCPLFERDNRTVQLTRPAIGCATGRHLLDDWQTLRHELRHVGEPLQGRLRCTVQSRPAISCYRIFWALPGALSAIGDQTRDW